MELVKRLGFVKKVEEKEPTKDDVMSGIREAVDEVKLIKAGKRDGISARGSAEWVITMSYNIIATAVFKRELKRLAKKFHSLKNEYAAPIETLEQDPLQGTP